MHDYRICTQRICENRPPPFDPKPYYELWTRTCEEIERISLMPNGKEHAFKLYLELKLDFVQKPGETKLAMIGEEGRGLWQGLQIGRRSQKHLKSLDNSNLSTSALL
jgi:hypothetical protein